MTDGARKVGARGPWSQVAFESRVKWKKVLPFPSCVFCMLVDREYSDKRRLNTKIMCFFFCNSFEIFFSVFSES